MPRLSAVIIALNEVKNIQACLDSVRFCDERVVVDSGSTDGTPALARSAGAQVWSRPFDDFASQKNFAIQKASGDWVLLVDADERVSDALKEEILRKTADSSVDGYCVLRRNKIFGRWMKHGAHGKDYQLRVVKKAKAIFYGAVHERVRFEGSVGKLMSPLWHHTTETIGDYMKKLNAYTTLEARLSSDRKPSCPVSEMKRKPLLRLGSLFFLKGAFLDGLEGIHFALLSAYYDFVSLAKHWESSQKETRSS